jgi:predicted porin
VTVYGIIDAGFIGGNSRFTNDASESTKVTPNTATDTANSTIATTTVTAGQRGQLRGNYNGFGQSAESTSRLGFKGAEDLGGGLSAIFTFETGLQPANATLSTFNTRQAFVGLKHSFAQTETGLDLVFVAAYQAVFHFALYSELKTRA